MDFPLSLARIFRDLERAALYGNVQSIRRQKWMKHVLYKTVIPFVAYAFHFNDKFSIFYTL